MKIIHLLLLLVFAFAGCGGSGGGGYYEPPGGGGGCRCTPWESCLGGACVFDASSQWDVIAIGGRVSERDSAGLPWDAVGGSPDPFVCLTVNGRAACSSSSTDTLSPRWNEILAAEVGAGSLEGGVYFEYWDEDLSSDDGICAGNVTVREISFSEGGFSVTCSDGVSFVDFALSFVR